MSVNLDMLLYRICSGEVELAYNKKNYIYSHPSNKLQYRASLVYQKTIEENEELLTREDMESFLIKEGKISEQIDQEIDTHIPKLIENLKVDIYKATIGDDRQVKFIREKLEKVKVRLFELLALKYSLDDYTVENLAEKEKNLFLILKCVKHLDISPENLLTPLSSSSISDTDIRKLTRHYSWGVKWIALKRGIKVFSGKLTEEQERLIKWSSIYENVQENEPPPDKVINDDDAFDGFLITRHRERDKDSKLNALDESLPDSAKRADEVFVMARSVEHAKEIHQMNSPDAIRTKERRFAQILEQGEVKESDLYDKRLKLQLAKNILASKGK